MKNLFAGEATFNNGRSEDNQTLNGPRNPKLEDRRVVRPPVAAYGWPVQSGRRSVRGYDDSDLMKPQLA